MKTKIKSNKLTLRKQIGDRFPNTFANVVVRRLSTFVNSFLSIKKEKTKQKIKMADDDQYG